MQRPTFDQFFLGLAFVVSLRSEDPDTRHGAIIVSKKDNIILGAGYNALPRKLNPKNYDLARPAKYSIMVHSEQNALLNLSHSIHSYPGGAKIYVTGRPCIVCTKLIYQAGIDVIYMAKRQGTVLEKDEKPGEFEKLIKDMNIMLIELPIDNGWIKQIL